MIPGEMLIEEGELELNVGRATVTLRVANRGDRPIQVGSHYHFYETNQALLFERRDAYGMRLNIAAGTAVRFEPGQHRTVELVALAGDRVVYGFAGQVMGKLAETAPDGASPAALAASASASADEPTDVQSYDAAPEEQP